MLIHSEQDWRVYSVLFNPVPQILMMHEVETAAECVYVDDCQVVRHMHNTVSQRLIKVSDSSQSCLVDPPPHH